jgi:hypothetical protein
MRLIGVYFILLITIFFFHSPCFALDTLEVKRKSSLIKSGKLVPLPVLYYTPETKIAGGLTIFNIFKTDSKDSILNTSMVRTSVNYTQNKQYWIELLHTIIFPKNRYIMTGNISYMKYPNFFYGIGSRTLEADKEQFSYYSTNFYLRFIKKIRGNSYLGLQYHFNIMSNVVFQSGGRLSQGNIMGAGGGKSSGLGLVFIYDSRNSVINTQKGIFIELSSLFNRETFGSSFQFDLYRLEIRKFFPLNDKGNKVLATQGLLMSASEKVPFHRMPMLGGDNLMRGYFFGRFRDRAMYVVQGEYRHQISKIFGFTAFGSIGDVASSISNLDFVETKHAYGAGLRIAINPKERLNLRVDYGRGSSGGLFYVTVGEAF